MKCLSQPGDPFCPGVDIHPLTAQKTRQRLAGFACALPAQAPTAPSTSFCFLAASTKGFPLVSWESSTGADSRSVPSEPMARPPSGGPRFRPVVGHSSVDLYTDYDSGVRTNSSRNRWHRRIHEIARCRQETQREPANIQRRYGSCQFLLQLQQ